jgi:hypothetical protein
MLAREKSQREDGSQTGGRERKEKRQKRPEKGKRGGPDGVGKSGSKGRQQVWRDWEKPVQLSGARV